MQQSAVIAEDVLAGNLRSHREQSEQRHAIIPLRHPSAGDQPFIESTNWSIGKYPPSVHKGGWDDRIYRKSGLALRHVRRSNSAVKRRQMQRKKAWMRIWHHWAQILCLVSNRDNHFFFHLLYSVLPYSPSTFAGGISADPQTRRQLSPRSQTSPLSWNQSYLWHRTLQMLCQKTKVTTEQKYIRVHFYLLTTLLWPLITVLAAFAVTTEKTQNRSSSSAHRYSADKLLALSGGAK